METPAAVHRYRNSFSIENILSKPRSAASSAFNDKEKNFNINMTSVHDCCVESVNSNCDKLSSVASGTVEFRASSPESSFNEDTLDDAKSDITSEDDHGKQRIIKY